VSRSSNAYGGKDSLFDTDNSINAAIRKIRQVLKDDAECPRFVQTITGRGYRFIADVVEGKRETPGKDAPKPAPYETASLRSRKASGGPRRQSARPADRVCGA